MRFKNENVQLPEHIIETGHWEYLSTSTSRAIRFKKIRMSSFPLECDYIFSIEPNVNNDGKHRAYLSGSTKWLGTSYLSPNNAFFMPNNNDWTDYNSPWSLHPISTVGTYIGIGLDNYSIYELTFPYYVYWSGLNNTSVYSRFPYEMQLYIEN